MEYKKDISTYNWFVDTLREAYMNDTLEAGSPCGCGTGNLLVRRYVEIHGPNHAAHEVEHVVEKWTGAFWTSRREHINPFKLLGVAAPYTATKSNEFFIQCAAKEEDHQAEELLKWLPIPKQVLMDLEWEFETNQTGESKDEQMFNGLMACIAVLDKYFETPPVTQNITKERFVSVMKKAFYGQEHV